MSDGQTLKMAEVLKGEDAEAFANEILQMRSATLTVDASEVTKIDTPCIEVLMSAQKLWSDDHCILSYSEMSEAFENAIGSIGIERAQLEAGGSQ